MICLRSFNTEGTENYLALGVLWVGLMSFSALIAKCTASLYQRPVSICQEVILRLILKGVKLLWLLFISVGRSTCDFEITSSARSLVEYLSRLQNLYTKWGLLSQIRHVMETERVIMTSDNQQTSLPCICNPEGHDS